MDRRKINSPKLGLHHRDLQRRCERTQKPQTLLDGWGFFLKCMLKPTLNLLVNLLRTCFGVSL